MLDQVGGMVMKKILVAYATRAGSTIDVAMTIASALRHENTIVDVENVKDFKGVIDYDVVVVGSAIRMGHWLPEAIEFVQNNKGTLSQIPTAYFLVSGSLSKDTPEALSTVLSYIDPVCAIIEPVSIGLFAGKIDYQRLPWIDRTIARMTGAVESDGRNWEMIRQWAEDLQKIIETSELFAGNLSSKTLQ